MAQYEVRGWRNATEPKKKSPPDRNVYIEADSEEEAIEAAKVYHSTATSPLPWAWVVLPAGAVGLKASEILGRKPAAKLASPDSAPVSAVPSQAAGAEYRDLPGETMATPGTPVSVLTLSERAKNALAYNRLDTIEKVKAVDDLDALEKIGPAVSAEVLSAIEAHEAGA